jgi:hypothetical protein
MRSRVLGPDGRDATRGHAEINLNRLGFVSDGEVDDLLHLLSHPLRFLQAGAHGQLHPEPELAFVHGRKEFASDKKVERQAADQHG